LHGHLGRTGDEQLPARLVAHAWHGIRLGQGCKREQRGDLGRGLLTFFRPARGLADIDELDLGLCPGLLGQFGKQGGFLGTGHHAIAASQGGLEIGGFTPAQFRVDGKWGLRLQRLPESLGIQRHGPIAVAQLD